jgi:hypothetical protein
MFVLGLKFSGRLHKIIMAGFVIALLISWTTVQGSGLIAYVCLMILAFAIIIYGLSQKKLSLFERLMIILSSCIVFGKLLFSLMHYPYLNEVRLASIIPVIAFFSLVIYTRMKLKPETGFMAILAILGLFNFLRLWMEI